MAQWLKQSTAVTVKVGPFVDATDAVTAETGLTIAQADIRLSKNGGAFAQTNNATGATHDEHGYYGVPLDTTDTGTLGTLRVAVSESGALPVWQDFMIVPANVWDSFFGADALQVDVVQVSGDSAAADNLESYTDGTTPIPANATQISGDSGAADNLEAALDGTGGVTLTAAVTGNITGTLSGSVGSVAAGGISAASFAAGAIDAAALATDALGSAELSTAAADEIATQVWAAATRTLTAHPSLRKNTASQSLFFLMVDSTDGVTPETGLTVTVQRSIDGAAFGNATGTVSEIANGWYRLATSQADTNGTAIIFRATATGARTREVVAYTYG